MPMQNPNFCYDYPSLSGRGRPRIWSASGGVDSLQSAAATVWLGRYGGAGPGQYRTSHADVFLVDLGLPDGSGQTIIQHITRVRPSARIMVLSTLGDPKHILSSLEMGAHGYLLKSESPEHILHHIITLVNEGGVLSGLASKIVIQEMAQRHPTSAQRSASGTAPAALTPKELRVLSLVQTGLPAKSIAFHLNISIFTVNQHLRSIYRKLNVRNKMEAVQSASNLGLL